MITAIARLPGSGKTKWTQTDIAILGAGPQGLTLVTHLLQKKPKWRHRFVIIDSSGDWLTAWRQQFKALEIPHLRSPAVHQPDPNPHALRTFAEHRTSELFPPYDLPGTQLFDDFCQEVIKRWQLSNCIYRGKVLKIIPITTSNHQLFRLVLNDGYLLMARRVVLATNYGHVQLPDWVNQIPDVYPEERLCHSHHIDLPNLSLAGEKILIIGGGLTSGHLTIGASKRNAKVILMARRNFQTKLFDADPGWLGPKYLKGFTSETDWHRRWQMIQEARNGGSLTPNMMLQLNRLAREGKVELVENCAVTSAKWHNNRWLLTCTNGKQQECDRIWLATGTRFEITQYPLLTDVLAAYPCAIVNGLPILDEYLRLGKSELFIMGGLAALQIGPVARNLAGGRKASDLIVAGLTKYTRLL